MVFFCKTIAKFKIMKYNNNVRGQKFEEDFKIF